MHRALRDLAGVPNDYKAAFPLAGLDQLIQGLVQQLGPPKAVTQRAVEPAWRARQLPTTVTSGSWTMAAITSAKEGVPVRVAEVTEADGSASRWRRAEPGEKGELVITRPYPYLARTIEMSIEGSQVGVFRERDELLLAHHVYRSGIVWGLPGGGVQYSESLERAVQREVREETGIEVRVDYLVQVHMDAQRPLRSAFFLCETDGDPQPKANQELFEAGFYPLDCPPGRIDPEQQAIVERALRIREHPELAQMIFTGTGHSEDKH